MSHRPRMTEPCLMHGRLGSKRLSRWIAVLPFLLLACNSEQAAWDRASEAQTVEAYEDFLAAHSGGPFAELAAERLFEVAYFDARASNTRAAYQEYAGRYPESVYALDAEARSRLFTVAPAGRGTIDIGQGPRGGPIVSIAPQWDSVHARFGEESVFALLPNGDTVSLEFVIPVDLGDNAAQTQVDSSMSQGQVEGRTIVPRVNTFTERNDVVATEQGRLNLVVEYAPERAPIKMGLLFERDLADLEWILVLGTSLPASVFR